MIAVGTNEEAVRLSGIDPRPVKLTTFVLSGLLAGLGAVFQVARVSSADPNGATGMELAAIAAVVIGGTSLMGGRGSVLRTFLGVLIIATLQTGLAQVGASEPAKRLITGAVIVLAVVADVHREPWATISARAVGRIGSDGLSCHAHRVPGTVRMDCSRGRRNPSLGQGTLDDSTRCSDHVIDSWRSEIRSLRLHESPVSLESSALPLGRRRASSREESGADSRVQCRRATLVQQKHGTGCLDPARNSPQPSQRKLGDQDADRVVKSRDSPPSG